MVKYNGNDYRFRPNLSENRGQINSDRTYRNLKKIKIEGDYPQRPNHLSTNNSNTYKNKHKSLPFPLKINYNNYHPQQNSTTDPISLDHATGIKKIDFSKLKQIKSKLREVKNEVVSTDVPHKKVPKPPNPKSKEKKEPFHNQFLQYRKKRFISPTKQIPKESDFQQRYTDCIYFKATQKSCNHANRFFSSCIVLKNDLPLNDIENKNFLHIKQENEIFSHSQVEYANLKFLIWKKKFFPKNKNTLTEKIKEIKENNWDKIKSIKQEIFLYKRSLEEGGKFSEIREKYLNQFDDMEEEIEEEFADIPEIDTYNENQTDFFEENKDIQGEEIDHNVIQTKFNNTINNNWPPEFWFKVLKAYRKYGFDVKKISKVTKFNPLRVCLFINTYKKDFI